MYLAKLWLEYSFRNERCQNYDELLPEYICISKSKKYLQFHQHSKTILLKHIFKVAFKSLKLNYENSVHVRNLMHYRNLRKWFIKLRNGTMSSKLLGRFIERSDQVRNIRLMKSVLHGLKLYVNQRLDDDDRFCEILKALKERIVGNFFNEWMF